MTEEKVAVIFPAAGTGSRMGGERKQFRLLGGHPLFIQTLRAFDRHPGIDTFILTTPPGDHVDVRAAVEDGAIRTPVILAPGGPSRQASVRAALDLLPVSAGIVLVHDAVRPFIQDELIRRVVDAIRTFGAAALAVEATDTLRRGAGEYFGETAPRDGLYRMQTPQGARWDWLVEAHAAALRNGVEATDDVALLQRVGRPVRIVEGGPLNIKVTTPADWELARQLWSIRPWLAP